MSPVFEEVKGIWLLIIELIEPVEMVTDSKLSMGTSAGSVEASGRSKNASRILGSVDSGISIIAVIS